MSELGVKNRVKMHVRVKSVRSRWVDVRVE